MTYSPLEEPLSPHWTACSRSPVDNMPSPDGSPTSPASPGYSITSPTYDSPHSPRSPFYQPTQSAKKDVYAYNWKDYVDDIPRLPSRPRALTPSGFRENDTQQLRNVTATYQKSSWFKIPPNLRRDILVLAFGGRRLHMCLKCDADPSNAWHFFGMVCRHVPAGAKGPMTRGLLQGPWSDECDFHQNDADPEVDLESIGVMGWLLSCRQNYAETIDMLYSKNTILMYDEPLLTYIDQVILPHRASLITSLEVKWEPEPAQDYDETFFNLLQPPRFPNLKRLYISTQFIWRYHSSWFDKMCGYMDNLVKARPGLTECAIAIPHQAFDDAASEYVKKKNSWKRGTYSQLWYSVDRSDGVPEAIRLPYVNSYPRPPFHLGLNSRAGWWLMEGTDAPLSWKWASSPIYYGSPTPGWEDWDGYGSN